MTETRAPYNARPNLEDAKAEALGWHAEAERLADDAADFARETGNAFTLCATGNGLYWAWCEALEAKDKRAARTAKDAYYAHRENCPECTHA